MTTPLLDLSYLQSLSGNDSNYLHDVLNLFLDTLSTGITTLEKQIRETDDFDAIRRQAHSLKSSTSIIKIRDVYENVTRIEALAIKKENKQEMLTRIDTILVNFNEALPLLQAEKEKNKPANS